MSEWISVDERLPENKQNVLIFDGGYITLVSFHAFPGGDVWWIEPDGYHWAPSRWMPLPPQPQSRNDRS